MAIGKTKDYSCKEFKEVLNQNGFTFVRCNGDHFIYKRGGETLAITKKPNKMICRRLIKTYNLKF